MARIRKSVPVGIYVLAQHVGDDEEGMPVCSEIVKIGISNDPCSRARTLQTGCPYPLLVVHIEILPTKSVAERIEAVAHSHLNHLRTSGEWFSAGVELACNTVIEATEVVQAMGAFP